jgi:hypothetical protein
MGLATFACARCATGNHPSERYCEACGLPLGSAQADGAAVLDVFAPYEAPDPSEADLAEPLRDLAMAAGGDVAPFGLGYRVIVPLGLDRHQAVYVGPAGRDAEGRGVLSLVSVCGPATDRHARELLQLNARVVEGHFAIQVLRGEAYFVVVHTLTASLVPGLDAAALVQRIARVADSLEDRLSRGRDLF